MDEAGSVAKALSLIGLAQRAGKAASGETACEQAVRNGSARAVILSCDASAGTEKKFSHRCFHYQVPLQRIACTKAELGKALGRGSRSCLAVCEEGLAKTIIQLTEKIDL